VLPATVSAVLIALDAAGFWQLSDWQRQKICILGKSDLLGTPLAAELRNRGVMVELLGRNEIEARLQNAKGAFADAQVVISAIGKAQFITGEMIRESSIIIDVGEPRPDVERASVEPKAAFFTPVPGGIGPLTVVSLLENAVELVTTGKDHND
jgi:methylenetetrahydrofolate dehydrogenase (NADP+)/methenyltetrahydrofolate cyclohydrolase